MKQIGNWVFGSFFRTIGRLLVFIVLGIIIAHFIDFGSIKDNFSITDLFLDKVSASTFKYGYIDNMYNSSGQSLPALQGYLAYNYMQNTNDENDFWFNNSHSDNAHGMTVPQGINYIHYTIMINPQVDGEYCSIGSSTRQLTGTWTNTSTGEGGSLSPIIYQYNTMECIGDNNTFSVVMRQQGDNFNVGVPCSIYGLTNNGSGANFANVSCPVLENTKWVSRITFFKLGTSVSATYGLNRTFYGEKPDGTNITNAINSQTQQQQQQHNEIMDSNMTETNETASNFFGSFSDSDTGGLSGIITAPLVMINKMLDGVCVQPSATWKGATISLPCGDLLWSRNGASDLKNLVNVFYGGFICYYAIRKLFLMIENLKDPTQDKIEVTDL